MEEVRNLGLLRPIPNGADRDIRVAVEWNRFVAGGIADAPEYGWRKLFDTPLAAALGKALWNEGMDRICEMRKAAGLDAFPADQLRDRTGARALMPIGSDEILRAAEAAAEGAALAGSGIHPFFMMGSTITCPKTDAHLVWAENRLIDPEIGAVVFPDGDFRKGAYVPLEAWAAPKPFRHVEIPLPSGILMMADWFRIPGFNDGVGKEDYSGPGIGSDLGIDQRTQDHFERLGLMRIHATNCVPSVMRDGEALRVGHFDEDHEDFWAENPDDPDDVIPSGLQPPEIVGRVCCDLWDVTFADREVLIDILMAGSAAIDANGGIGVRGDEVTGAPRDRDEAGAMLDLYAHQNDVAVVTFEPGTVLHCYMATGHGTMEFGEEFESADLERKEWLKDMFVLSARPLALTPDMAAKVDEPDWLAPEREDVPAIYGEPFLGPM